MLYFACAEYEYFNFFVNFSGSVDAFLLWDLGAMLSGAAAAWREVFYILSQVTCEASAAYWYFFFGALNCFLALVKFDLVLTAGVSVIVSGFVGAKGSVGTTMSGQVDLQGGNSRPPWNSPPGAAASMVLGSCTKAFVLERLDMHANMIKDRTCVISAGLSLHETEPTMGSGWVRSCLTCTC